MEITKAWGDRAYRFGGVTFYIDNRPAADQKAAQAAFEAAGPEATVRQSPTDSFTGCGSSTRKIGP